MRGGEGAARGRVVLAAAAVVLVAAFAAIGRVADLHRHIPLFLSLYALAFAGYLLGLRVAFRAPHPDRFALIVMLVAAVAARAAALPARPDLSSDIYRYAWEGRVLMHGVDPFVVAPADTSLAFLRDDDYPRINHKDFATIYPPLAQGIFLLGAHLHPGVRTLKVIFTVFDLATIGVLLLLLRRRGRPPTHALAYAWSPLVIVETAHSGHLDAAGVFFLVAGLALAARPARAAAFVAFGASILVKYLALALLPLFAVRRRWWGIALLAAVVAAGYLPFAGAGRHLFSSLQAYGHTWWFNGPPFMALSGLLADPVLARRLLMGAGVAFAIAVAFRERDLARGTFLIVACILLLSPTVYPWYLVWIVPLLCLYPSRAWIAFTGLVMISYAVWMRYDATGIWMIPNRLLALEYVPFYGILAWEGLGRPRRRGTADA